MAPSDHLYYAEVSHEEFVEAMGPAERRVADKIATEDPDNWDLTACVFVTAASASEARERLRDHYGVDTPVTLVASGFVTIRANLFEPGVALGVRGDVDPQEIEKCPECHSNHVRHDASAGDTECVSCGWGMEWKGK